MWKGKRILRKKKTASVFDKTFYGFRLRRHPLCTQIFGNRRAIVGKKWRILIQKEPISIKERKRTRFVNHVFPISNSVSDVFGSANRRLLWSLVVDCSELIISANLFSSVSISGRSGDRSVWTKGEFVAKLEDSKASSLQFAEKRRLHNSNNIVKLKLPY